MSNLTFDALRRVNALRQENDFPVSRDWSESDWGNAIAGEVGEMCNLIKKRLRGEPIPDEDVAKEMADVVTYIDLLASKMGVDLGSAVVQKFNEVSRRVGSSVRFAEGD